MIIKRFLLKLFSYWFSKNDTFQNIVLQYFASSAFYLQGQMDINPKGKWFNQEFVNKSGGYYLLNDNIQRSIVEIDPWDNSRRDMIILLLRNILYNNVPGCLAEIGVYKGLTARLIHYYVPDRVLYLFDTFNGFTEHDLEFEKNKTGLLAKKEWFNNTSVEFVWNYLRPLNDNIIIKEGPFPDTFDESLDTEEFSFVHLDLDLYNPIIQALKLFYPKMKRGGIILVHDYMSWIGAYEAVNDFCSSMNLYPIIMPDKNGSAVIMKT
jgi:O-methyltransferase